jgi:hypothetical protein
MKLFTQAQLTKLHANGADRDKDHAPVVKLFTPDAGATWLISEIDPQDPDYAFGLCDLGMGEPELGTIYLPEIVALRGAYGLPVERDLSATFDKPMSHYADVARANGMIMA